MVTKNGNVETETKMTKGTDIMVKPLSVVVQEMWDAIEEAKRIKAEVAAMRDDVTKHADEAADAARKAANKAVADLEGRLTDALEQAMQEFGNDLSALRARVEAIIQTIKAQGVLAAKL